VRTTRAARQALVAVLEMAASGPRPVTVGDAARRNGIPETALAKVVQRLVRAGLAVGSRGVGGGYRLSRAPSAITVAEVLSVFEPPPPRGGPLDPRVESLFSEVDEAARATFASVSLATLARATVTPRAARRLTAVRPPLPGGNGVS
jgi:Rrf2 family protein